jgi:2'-5' RNA ligase
VPDPGERTIGVAIPIPDPHGRTLQRYRAAFGDPLAPSIPAHITLVPPIRVAGGALEEIEGHLRAVAAQERPFPIRLRGTGTFRPISPVVFVSLAIGIGECENLERRIRRGPLERTSGFPYHPHVTVAHHLSEDLLDRAAKQLSEYEAEFAVGGFSVYEHGLDGVWRPQREFVFGAGLSR